MTKKIGKQTYLIENKISVANAYSVVGPYEGKGPLKKYFDIILEDDLYGKDSYEQAESAMIELACCKLINSSTCKCDDIDLILGGDLLNQIVPTTFAVKNLNIPYWGLYNACSTFAEGMQIGSVVIDSNACKKIIVSSSSHFSSSERQYRTPLELGSQAPSYSQRTVTGVGCVMLEGGGDGPYVTAFTVGRVLDFDIMDPFDMGSAMAPSAADTIIRHFKDTNTSFDDYDMVVTGDLAFQGVNILDDILSMEGYPSKGKLSDCGLIIYDRENQQVNNGGSGAGCCSSVFAGYWYEQMKKGKLNKLLFVPTGALLSATTYQQKLTIPSMAHAVVISNIKE